MNTNTNQTEQKQPLTIDKAAAVKETPMLFNGEMVRAILSGQKTQTRRIAKVDRHPDDPEAIKHVYPFVCVGDRIWVRETHGFSQQMSHAGDDIDFLECIYTADGGSKIVTPKDDNWAFDGGRKYPSIHMPRWASRITLEIVSVRLERLQKISQVDARAEGVSGGCLSCGEENCKCSNPRPDWRDAFAGLWMQVYGDESWINDPLVWVIEFRRMEVQP